MAKATKKYCCLSPRSVVAIARIDHDDGVRFNHESVVIVPIAEAAEYKGVRAKLEVRMTAARKMLQLDIGFGDTVVPGPVEMDFPTLRDKEAQWKAFLRRSRLQVGSGFS